MVLTTCRKSCCWTPFGTCAKKRECRCHPKADKPRSTPSPEQRLEAARLAVFGVKEGR